MINEELVCCIQRNEEPTENMEKLYVQLIKFVRHIVKNYAGCGVDLDDLEQEGVLGIYSAINGFNPDKDVKFTTYAEIWIRNKVLRYIRDNGRGVRLPGHVRDHLRKYNRFLNTYQENNGFAPSDVEASDGLGIDLDRVEELKRAREMLNLASLDSPISGGSDGSEIEMQDTIPAAGSLEDDVVNELYASELSRTLWGCVDSLPVLQVEIIKRRYQEGQTLRQVSGSIGSAVETVRQQEKKALRALRNAQELRPFVEDRGYIYNKGLRGGGVGCFQRTWTSSTERVAIRNSERS